MKKFLFSKEYLKVTVIGFDLDGTLYDEFEFIRQVYDEITCRLVDHPKDVRGFMLARWLEKGSSYPFIFKEAQNKFNLNMNFEKTALDIFRNFSPRLVLPSRMHYVLTRIKEDGKQLFLLTDGKEKLQNQKIEALQIRNKFDYIIIAHDLPKPDCYYGELIKKFFTASPSQITYIGDRKVDKDFATNCGFHFVNNRELI